MIPPLLELCMLSVFDILTEEYIYYMLYIHTYIYTLYKYYLFIYLSLFLFYFYFILLSWLVSNFSENKAMIIFTAYEQKQTCKVLVNTH